MTTIFKNNILEIKKIRDNYYSFLYDTAYQFLFSSLHLEMYKSKEETEKEEIQSKTIKTIYNFDSVQTLKQILERKDGLLRYSDTQNLFLQIGSQLVNLDRNDYVYPFLDVDNIIIINDETFIYIGENIIKKEKNNTISITRPYKKTFLFSPELYNIKELPKTLPSNSWIYSLGVLSILCLTGNKRLLTNIHKEKNIVNSFKQMIDMIQDTKLYFSILRCVERNPLKRIFLYI